MAHAFLDIAFTPAVREQQARLGSAKVYERALKPEADPSNLLGEAEAKFIEARDGFFQATVSETGWPYVQFKGGAAGFLKVLDARTIAYADLGGNRQYISLGNLKTDDRVSMILVDYPNRRRLKVFGRVRFVEDDPELVESLMVPAYRARAERAVMISVEGIDWNCPAHIPQRLTLEELKASLEPLRQELARLTAENESLKASLAARTDEI
ncbi:MAG: pyridoxamine 5'-phosphate oxidase family protein [Pseudomonadota bacterium]